MGPCPSYVPVSAKEMTSPEVQLVPREKRAATTQMATDGGEGVRSKMRTMRVNLWQLQKEKVRNLLGCSFFFFCGFIRVFFLFFFPSFLSVFVSFHQVEISNVKEPDDDEYSFLAGRVFREGHRLYQILPKSVTSSVAKHGELPSCKTIAYTDVSNGRRLVSPLKDVLDWLERSEVVEEMTKLERSATKTPEKTPDGPKSKSKEKVCEDCGLFLAKYSRNDAVTGTQGGVRWCKECNKSNRHNGTLSSSSRRIRDPNLVKKALSAYAIFVMETARKIEPGDDDVKNNFQKMAEKWRALTKEEKVPYYDQHQQDVKRHKAEVEGMKKKPEIKAVKNKLASHLQVQ
jgi:hypothetical protein